MIRIDVGRPEGVRWVPEHHVGDGALVLAGSSGRIDEDRTKVFAGYGCVAESIRWFGGPGQHAGPWDIPVETFLRRIDDLTRTCDRVYVVGSSFGAEAAMLCGAHSPGVAGVIAFAPSDVVWAGYDDRNRETSHWTLNGKRLPYVPLDWRHGPREGLPRFRPLYEQSRLTFADRVPAATIAVDRIERMILVAGGDDQVWPSVLHAARIQALRQASGRQTTGVTDPDAGHRTILPGESVVTGGSPMQRGGTQAADRRLGSRAWDVITALLDHAR